MIWFGKSFINFCKSFINLIKLVSTRTCSSARVRRAVPAGPSTASRVWPAGPGQLVVSLALESHWQCPSTCTIMICCQGHNQGRPSRAESRRSDSWFCDSAKMSDLRLGNWATLASPWHWLTVTRAQGREHQGHLLSHCICASSLSQALMILSSSASLVTNTISLFG